jgi:hypothetical protein
MLEYQDLVEKEAFYFLPSSLLPQFHYIFSVEKPNTLP